MLFRITIAEGTGEFSRTGIFDSENREAAIELAKSLCNEQWPIDGVWKPVPHKGEEWPHPDAVEFFLESEMWGEDQIEDATQYDHTVFMYVDEVELNTFFPTE